MPPRVMIAIDGGEPILVFWRLEDLREALRVADDIGLPLTSPPDVEEELLVLIRRALADLDLEAPGLAEASAKPGASLPLTPRAVSLVALTRSWRP